ncbi:Hypothetical protein PAU_02693 [Photorhabdus asymbiotica]|uniref:Uncharacterized protein n=1 Tax=Photorhabdus asymbiotica subsp. asymbiotica (strain ATCC 43949 / 3105-77) TaxID=553480 RepID=C7BPK2_PHOAA|nr:Hypothetical protein PAU_02693 [Photorhabdus asymbiotica]
MSVQLIINAAFFVLVIVVGLAAETLWMIIIFKSDSVMVSLIWRLCVDTEKLMS